MPLHAASARHEATSLCAPQGSPAGEGHQSVVRNPHVDEGRGNGAVGRAGADAVVGGNAEGGA